MLLSYTVSSSIFFLLIVLLVFFFFFFFNDTATTEIYTLSLHDALPIYSAGQARRGQRPLPAGPAHPAGLRRGPQQLDRKSTRLNSSHLVISYAVFCLKKKKKKHKKKMHITIIRNLKADVSNDAVLH